jgi:arsenical pump membrane protein
MPWPPIWPGAGRVRPINGSGTFPASWNSQTSQPSWAQVRRVPLPTFAALAPVTDGSVPRTVALLIGTSLGPLILLWGSLATLLWRERCAARGVRISARELAAVDILGVPVLLAAATAGLLFT